MTTSTPSSRSLAKAKARSLDALQFLLLAVIGIGLDLLVPDWDTATLSRRLATLASLSGTLLGFTVTSMSITMAISDRPFVVNLRKTGHYKNLVDHLFHTAGILLIAMVLALVGLFITDEWRYIFPGLAVGVFVLAVLSFLSVGRKFKMVITRLITSG